MATSNDLMQSRISSLSSPYAFSAFLHVPNSLSSLGIYSSVNPLRSFLVTNPTSRSFISKRSSVVANFENAFSLLPNLYITSVIFLLLSLLYSSNYWATFSTFSSPFCSDSFRYASTSSILLSVSSFYWWKSLSIS